MTFASYPPCAALSPRLFYIKSHQTGGTSRPLGRNQTKKMNYFLSQINRFKAKSC
jgi:hypothetical protein